MKRNELWANEEAVDPFLHMGEDPTITNGPSQGRSGRFNMKEGYKEELGQKSGIVDTEERRKEKEPAGKERDQIPA